MLTIERDILAALRESGPCSVSALASRMGRERVNVGNVLRRLERAGRVEHRGRLEWAVREPRRAEVAGGVAC